MAKTTARTPTAPAEPLFKVLVEGQSCHGGAMKWNLPNGEPGDWHQHKGVLAICQSGFHLTNDPIRWWKEGSKVFEAEAEGDLSIVPREGDKICVNKCRLLREVEWAEFQVWSEGHHVTRAGQARVSGNATAELYGNATAELYDNATAELYGNATAELYDNATAKLYGNATAKLYDNATAKLYDSSTVTRSRYHSPGATVELQAGSEAVCIDRRGKVTVTTAPEVAA